MRLGSGTRRGLLFGALALTLAAVQWVDGNDDTVGKPRPPAAPAPRAASDTPRTRTPATQAPSTPATGAAIDLDRLQRGRGAAVRDAFAQRNWQPPPRRLTPAETAAMAPPPPPPPQAPPLPFVYVGMLAEESRTTVFLSQGSRDIAVRTGETIDNTYRVEAVTSERIELTYLPLNQRQTLPLGTP